MGTTKVSAVGQKNNSGRGTAKNNLGRGTIFTCGDGRQVKEWSQLLLLGGCNVFVRPLDDLVAQSCTNNLGRYCNFKKPDLQQFLSVTNLF